MSSTEKRPNGPELGSGPWNPRQERVAVLLASGSTVVQAAAETGAGERTVHGWLDNPGYRAFVARTRDRILDSTIGRLTDSATRAVAVLESLLGSENDSVRLRAATSILDALIKTREHSEIASRVAELEQRVAETGEVQRWAG